MVCGEPRRPSSPEGNRICLVSLSRIERPCARVALQWRLWSRRGPSCELPPLLPSRDCTLTRMDRYFFSPGEQTRPRLRSILVKAQSREGNRGGRKSTRLNSTHSQISYAAFCF